MTTSAAKERTDATAPEDEPGSAGISIRNSYSSESSPESIDLPVDPSLPRWPVAPPAAPAPAFRRRLSSSFQHLNGYGYPYTWEGNAAQNQQATRTRSELAALRERTFAARLNTREKRAGLRRVRGQASDVEARFITAVRQLREGVTARLDLRLLELYEEVVSVRDRLGTLEEEYNETEDAYNALEFTFDRQEEEFYLSRADGLENEPPLTHEQRTDAATSEARAPSYADLVRQYSVRKKHVDDLRSTLCCLHAKRDRRLAKTAVKAHWHVEDPHWDTTSLTSGEEYYAYHIDMLRTTEAALDELKQRLLAPADMPTSRRASIAGAQVNRGETEAPDRARCRSDTVLHSRRTGGGNASSAIKVWFADRSEDVFEERSMSRCRSESALDGLRELEWDYQRRVNTWLVEYMRGSPVERVLEKDLLDYWHLDQSRWLEIVGQSTVASSVAFGNVYEALAGPSTSLQYYQPYPVNIQSVSDVDPQSTDPDKPRYLPDTPFVPLSEPDTAHTPVHMNGKSELVSVGLSSQLGFHRGRSRSVLTVQKADVTLSSRPISV